LLEFWSYFLSYGDGKLAHLQLCSSIIDAGVSEHDLVYRNIRRVYVPFSPLFPVAYSPALDDVLDTQLVFRSCDPINSQLQN
jgi:hypothetical protein